MSAPSHGRRSDRLRPRRLVAAVAAAAVGAGLLTTLGTASAASAATTRDGRTEATALASCWDVKQTDPTATDGTYWLWTPSLPYPQQFFCDMTTDGGGWVLIGRGRDNWSFLPEGQGTAAEVAATVTGPAAFAPKALPTTTVNGLLDGVAVKDLPDGIRLRRATNSAGTTWQDDRAFPLSMGEWRWSFGNGYPLVKARYAGVTTTFSAASYWTVTAPTMGYSCPVGGLNCLDTRRINTNNNSKPGFGYGSGVAVGTVSTTNYLWNEGGNAVPFTQVYLRPKLRWADLSVTPVGTGLAATAQRVAMDNFARPQAAGVSGLANGLTTERDTEVRTLARIGSTVYVGGNFAQVDEYGATTTSTKQAYLAAFDVSTGAWISAFRPTLNGKVNALAALPDGTLAVGGEFTTVNGAARAGLVVLDPTTGATSTSYRFGIQRRTTSGTTTTVAAGSVTGISLQGGWLYVAGQFTHTAGGTSALSGYSYTKRGARFSLATGRPDATWNPAFDATPIFVLASSRGDRVYFGGFMNTMNDGATPAVRFVTVTTTSPAKPVAGLQPWVTSTPKAPQYQQTALEVGDRFVLGGAEHHIHFYERADLTSVRGSITRSEKGPGGDFQATAEDAGVVYGSCHCSASYNFGGRTLFSQVDPYDDLDLVRFQGAYDLQTGRYVPGYTPWIKTRAVRGPWAMLVDQNSCLWTGGDLTQTKRVTDKTWQPSGGFAVFCRRDSSAPTTPTGLTSTPAADGSTVTLSWTGATDDRTTALRYVVYADDVPVASTMAWKVTLPAGQAAGTYVVRAIDAAGNRGASTEPLAVTVP